MQIEIVAIDKLQHAPYNPRKHPEKAIERLKHSIERFGYTNPVLVQKDTNLIIAGHARVKAASKAGLKEVPVIFLNFDDVTAKAYNIADNRLAELTEWDMPALKDLVIDIDTGGIDIELTGFSENELEKIIGYSPFAGKEEGFDVDTAREEIKEPRTKYGDLYQLGDHRLLCGDATKREEVERLVAGKRAEVVFTDPPYNVNYGSVVNHPSWKRTEKKGSGGKNADKGTDKIIGDHQSPEEWDKFVRAYMQNIFTFVSGAIYICMSNKEMYSNKHIFEELGGHWASFIIWKKHTFVLSMQDYHRQYEPILYGWKEGSPHYWCGDRTQSDIWEVDRPMKSPDHPTMKPVDLVSRAIQNSTKRGGTVLDLFAGSGSTLIAAEKTKRVANVCEIEPVYCDVIVDRWQSYTGKTANLAPQVAKIAKREEQK